MPAIITHDLFGKAAYANNACCIGLDLEQHLAFLLGNQGPDPLFYARANPSIFEFARFGSTMHQASTNEMLIAFHEALNTLPENEKPVGRAYLLGFLCHYLLDSTVHPLVYAHEFALCDAGVPGLTRADGNEVHAVIESEFDEVMLYKHTGKTIATFKPYKEILQASDETLTIIGKLYSYMAAIAFQKSMQTDVFRKAVKSFRLVQNIFYSNNGVKRSVLAQAEELVRPHSFYRSMSHRVSEATESEFDNHQGDVWVNPFTKQRSVASLDQLFDQAQDRVNEVFALFDAPNFTQETAQAITGGCNFSGIPLEEELGEKLEEERKEEEKR